MEVVSYLGHPGLSKKGSSWAGVGWPGSLFGCFASSCIL